MRHLRMLPILILATTAAAVTPTMPPALPPLPEGPPPDARAILERYVAAWRGPEEMALARRVIAGFWVSGEGGGEFHVTFTPEGGATLGEGVPEAFDGGFRTDIATLRRLDRGELSALTALGRAKWSDRAAMDPVLPGDGRLTPERQALLLPLTFHFWNREWPETVRFGEGTTRFVHGGNAAIFYYDKGFRSGWYQIKEGMHVNSDPSDQTNPFPSLFIITRGHCSSRLGGAERTLSEGEAVLVPAGMTHEFWAGPGQYAELVMVCFGDGA
jgi:mannose-6-phosphate isomerase-like protein (cupin superfamily)